MRRATRQARRGAVSGANKTPRDFSEQPRNGSPTAPSPTTPRSMRSFPQTGAISITYTALPSCTRSAEGSRLHRSHRPWRGRRGFEQAAVSSDTMNGAVSTERQPVQVNAARIGLVASWSPASSTGGRQRPLHLRGGALRGSRNPGPGCGSSLGHESPPRATAPLRPLPKGR